MKFNEETYSGHGSMCLLTELNQGVVAAKPLNPVLSIELKCRFWDASLAGVTNTAPAFPRDCR